MTQSRSDRRATIRGGIVAILVAAGALWLPATSFAGQDTIFNGYAEYSGYYGPRHTLTSVWTTWYNYDDSCINALNGDGSGWAGTTVCSDTTDINVGHGYCACNLKYGFGQAKHPGGQTYAYTRQFW